MEGTIKFIAEKFGPWMFRIIVYILEKFLFYFVIISLGLVRLFKWIAWGVIFGTIFRFIDRGAKYLVIK